VIAGDVAVMVALAAVVIAAALWRPARHGAVLLIGATIPMVAQAISALVQAGEAATPAQFGISPAQAQRIGLTISSGLTTTFWIYCALVLVLVVSCAWMLFTPGQSAGVAAGPYPGTQPDDDLWRAAQPEPDHGTWASAARTDDDAVDAAPADPGDGDPTDPGHGAWQVPPADAFDLAGVPSPGPAADDTATTTDTVTATVTDTDTATASTSATDTEGTAVPDPGTPADDRTEPAAAANLPLRSAE